MIQFLFNAFSLTEHRMSSRKSACLYPSRVIILYYYHPNYTLENFVVLLHFWGFSGFQECVENALLSSRRSGGCVFVRSQCFHMKNRECVFKAKPLERRFSTPGVQPLNQTQRYQPRSDLSANPCPVPTVVPIKILQVKNPNGTEEMFFFITSDEKMLGSAFAIMAE